MGAANFKTQREFPLYALSDGKFKMGFCPACECWMNTDDSTCPECGGELEDIGYDEVYASDYYSTIEDRLEDENDNLLFYRIELESGYYSGVQFYVDERYDSPEYIKEFWNNEDCRDQFDMCKSETVRKAEAERRKVNRLLEKLAKEYGFDKLGIMEHFSNGETWLTA